MIRRTIALTALLVGLGGCGVRYTASPHQISSPGSSSPVSRKVSPQDLYWPTAKRTYEGWNHKYCQRFSDPDSTICQGPITKVEVAHGGYIYGLRLYYGRTGIGDYHGLVDRSVGNVQDATWPVPDGERITRIEGEYGPKCVNQLQFFTNGNSKSPLFGTSRGGTRFRVTDPAGGILRTISGWANPQRRHEATPRALTSITFHFEAPCFIEDIHYDPAVIEAARQRSVPEGFFSNELENVTSLEQKMEYAETKEVKTSRTVTFEQSYGLTFGKSRTEGLSVSAELTATLKKVGLGIGVGVEKSSETWEQRSESTTNSQSYATSTAREVSWSIPVRVPARKKVIAFTTVRRYEIRVPFTYTVAWYETTEDGNIDVKKRITLPGVYEGTRVEDLKHDLVEAPLDDGP
jgi:hypothetical protein